MRGERGGGGGVGGRRGGRLRFTGIPGTRLAWVQNQDFAVEIQIPNLRGKEKENHGENFKGAISNETSEERGKRASRN